MSEQACVVVIPREAIQAWLDKDNATSEPNPDGVPCFVVECPLSHYWKENPDWMYVPWDTSQVNPHCKDADCPFYNEAMS